MEPKAEHCIYNSPSLVPILRQINPTHALPTDVFKIRFNIILPSMPWSSKWSLFLRFPCQKSVCTSLLPHMCHMPCPSHYSALITRIPLLMSSPRPCVFLSFYGKELLAPRPTPKAGESSPVGCPYCLFNTVAATLHIWWLSPPSAAWGRAMPWWQVTTYHHTIYM